MPNQSPFQVDIIKSLIQQLEASLSRLAMYWRGSDSDEEADAIAHN
jgi:hypothetical protein